MAGLKGWGIALVLLGVGSFILPLFGLQFKLLYVLAFIPLLLGIPSPELVGSLLLIIIGGVLWYIGSKKEKRPAPQRTRK